MKKVNLLSRAEMRKVLGGVVPPDGTPGGDNGNPCPEYCEPVGGLIVCLGYHEGVHYAYEGNCNQYPYQPFLHNKCLNSVNGDFWC